MRKLMGLKVALLVVCLLTMAAVPAAAQLADPLSLAAAGVLLPFIDTGATGDVSLKKVAVPIKLNAYFDLTFVDTNSTYHLEPMSSVVWGQLRTAATSFAPLAMSTMDCPKPSVRDVANVASITCPPLNNASGVPIRPRKLLMELMAGLGMVGPVVVAVVTDKLRLQFDFSPDAVRDLDELKKEMGLTSRVDVVKHALGLLQWVVRMRQRGAELLIEEKGEHRVVVLPLLSSSRAASARRG